MSTIPSLNKTLKYFRTPSLLACKSRAKNRNPYTGEASLSIQFANFLKAKTIEGKCLAVWTKIANENSSKSLSFGVMMRNMGKNPGVADFLFGSPIGTVWIELKDGKKGKLTEHQEYFKEWCECLNKYNHYYVCTNLDEAIKLVYKLNIIID